MSIVAVKVTPTCIELASDSIMVRGYTQSKSINKYSKLVKINDMFIGSVGTAEESSLLWVFTNTRRPEQATESALLTFLSEFADWKNSKIGKASIENEYIFVLGTKVFQVENFFIQEVLEYAAIGAGMDYALAALYLGFSVEKAVETACELSVYCEKPINYHCIEK